MLITFVSETLENFLTWFRIFISWLFCNHKKLAVEGKDTVMVHSFGSVQPCLHVQKDVQVRDASASVSLEEIQQRVFVKYVFWFSCLWFQDRTFSLILLVFP